MAAGRVKGTGRTHTAVFSRATSSAATIDTRKAETQSGSAAPPGAGERDPVRGPPKTLRESYLQVPEDGA